MIEIRVDRSIVSVQETMPLYAGTVDMIECHFSFDKSWNGFGKTAIFRVGTQGYTVLMDENDCCMLPWETLTRGNIGREIEVGVYGVSGENKILTSVWDKLGVVREGSCLGMDAIKPADGIYEQILAQLQQIHEAMETYMEAVRVFAQRAETAARLAKESAENATRIYAARCIEYGMLAYNSDTVQELCIHFSQCYSEEPVFLAFANHASLTVTVEPLYSVTGYYGGRIFVSNTSGEDLSAVISVTAYCAQPVDKESGEA